MQNKIPTVEELAEQFEKEIFWKYEKFNPEVNHKVCMISGRGLATEVSKQVRNQLIEARISGMNSILCDMQECPAKKYHNKRITELEKMKTNTK